MNPTDALDLIQNSLLARLPQEKLKAHNEAFECLRKLVVDDLARRKNAESDRVKT